MHSRGMFWFPEIDSEPPETFFYSTEKQNCLKHSEAFRDFGNCPKSWKNLKYADFLKKLWNSYFPASDKNPKLIRNSSETRPKLGRSETRFCLVLQRFINNLRFWWSSFGSETFPKLSETLGVVFFFQKYQNVRNSSKTFRNSPKLSEGGMRGGKPSGWGGFQPLWRGEADGGLNN